MVADTAQMVVLKESSESLVEFVLDWQPLMPESSEEEQMPYPQLAKLVRQILGDLTYRQAAIRTRGAISHDTIWKMAKGDPPKNTEKMDDFALAFGVNPNTLRAAANRGILSDFPPPESSALALEYQVDFDTLPKPEGYDELDQEGKEYVLFSLEAAVAAARRRQRQKNTLGFGADRYEGDLSEAADSGAEAPGRESDSGGDPASR